MKRVLFTGPSGISCGQGNKLGIISNTTSLERAFESQGVKVERREVQPGEDLSIFDLVVVTQQNIASFVAPFALGMAYSVGFCVKNSVPLIINFDDWQAPDAFKYDRYDSPQTDKAIECAWKDSLGRKNLEYFKSYSDLVDLGIETLCVKGNGLKYLIPLFVTEAFTTKAREKINCHGEHLFYSPYPYMANTYRYTDDQGRRFAKYRRHILAALQENDRWLRGKAFQWDVIQFGVRKLGQNRVTESQLAKIYASSWSVLSPSHRNLVGCGWFRVRNVMAAEAGSILLADLDDCMGFGRDYCYTYHEIEGADDQELTEIAETQKKHLQSAVWTKEALDSFAASLI